jgi:hypothetical protein
VGNRTGGGARRREGGNLAVAARDGSDETIAAAANGLGQAIVAALLEVFDGLVDA